MANDRTSTEQIPIWPLIKVPAIITLAVTFLRLVGELEHWSRTYFGQAGGYNAIVGITWLAPLFGIFFAAKLVRAGYGPFSAGRALGFAGAGRRGGGRQHGSQFAPASGELSRVFVLRLGSLRAGSDCHPASVARSI